MGEPDQAIAAIEAAIEHDPSIPGLYSFYGSSLGQLGRIREAIKAFMRAVQQEPKLAAAHAKLARAFAADTFKEAVRLDAGRCEFRMMLVECMLELG